MALGSKRHTSCLFLSFKLPIKISNKSSSRIFFVAYVLYYLHNYFHTLYVALGVGGGKAPLFKGFAVGKTSPMLKNAIGQLLIKILLNLNNFL